MLTTYISGTARAGSSGKAVRPSVRSARACSPIAIMDRVTSRPLATAAMLLPSSSTSRRAWLLIRHRTVGATADVCLCLRIREILSIFGKCPRNRGKAISSRDDDLMASTSAGDRRFRR
jgi:hypothetical protein